MKGLGVVEGDALGFGKFDLGIRVVRFLLPVRLGLLRNAHFLTGAHLPPGGGGGGVLVTTCHSPLIPSRAEVELSLGNSLYATL